MDPIIPAIKHHPGQFRLSLEGAAGVFDNALDLLMVRLEYQSLTPVQQVYDREGVPVGAVLGVIIDTSTSSVVRGGVHLDLHSGEPGFAEAAEEAIYRYSGSWIFLLVTHRYQRIYLDPCGSLSLVYAPERRLVASTVGLLLDNEAYRERFEGELHRRLGVEKNGWFPGGLTAHRGVRRLTANHYLDLHTWQPVRHWPREDFVPDVPLASAARRIGELITSTIRAMEKDGSTVLAITGGRDSRLLLAACRSFIANIGLVTVALPGSERDVHLARRLTGIEPRISHSVLAPILASDVQRQEWLYNASHCVGGTNQFYSPSLEPLREHRYFISGAGGEIGRAFLWRDSDRAEQSIDAARLRARLGLSYHPLLDAALNSWLSGVERFNLFTVLDLAYAELRVSSWAFAQAYAYVGKGYMNQISPFVNRELIAILCSLSPDDRRAGAYIHEGISAMWPVLLDVPFNRYGSLKDYWELLRALSDPVRVVSRLRKLALGR